MMRKIVILCLILASLSGFAQNFTNTNYVQVTGSAEEEITPNEIYLQITINEQDNKGKESVESLENKMIEKLKALNIDLDNDLAVKDLTSNFQKYFLKQNDIFTSKEYQLILHDAQTTGQVFQELESIGISNINIKKVDHSNMEEYETDVRIKAVRNAKEKAVGLAAAIQQQVGKALYIHEFENYNPRPLMGLAAGISLKRINENLPADQSNIEFEKK